MGVTGTVHHDLRALEAALREYPRALLQADVRTKNRTAAATRTEAVRRLRAELPGLKAGVIRRQMKIVRATSTNPRALLEFTAKRFRLFGNFNARQTKGGVRVSRLPWRIETLDGDIVPPQILAHAFIQRGRRSGVPHVWIRVGPQRYPITALLGSSLATAFKQRGLGSELIAFGRSRFRIVFGQEMRYRLFQVRRSPAIAQAARL